MMGRDAVTITDHRTGTSREAQVEGGAIRASDLAAMKTAPDDPGLMAYDPSLTHTASCKSAIGFVDGQSGVLRYRGYPIEELAARSDYLETAYLIVKGELPNAEHFASWKRNVMMHTLVHENIKKFIDGFRYDAHPMGMLVGTVGALSTFYPDARDVLDLESRRLQTRRLIGKMPTLAAFAFRRSRGLPYIYPDNDLGYTANFLSMCFKMTEVRYRPEPAVERALDVLFILHAEHEQTCSTSAVRCIASTHADPYSAVAAGIAALHGPRHGGANEDAVRMLQAIGSVDHVREFLAQVKAGERDLAGFGHRIYRSQDPRAKLIKSMVPEVYAVCGHRQLLDVATELERQTLEDDYFVSRGLYPNFDFYAGLVYEAIGFPPTMFPVLFAIARTAGWMAHWAELIRDPEQRLTRPRQIYVGEPERHYTPIGERPEPTMREDAVSTSI